VTREVVCITSAARETVQITGRSSAAAIGDASSPTPISGAQGSEHVFKKSNRGDTPGLPFARRRYQSDRL
jgi:hypothetical protein